MGGAQELHGNCAGGGGDKCRKVKCTGGAREVCEKCTGSGGDKCRKVKCTGGAREVVGISAQGSSAWEVHGRWWG